MKASTMSGAQFRALRLRAGMTQRKLAELIGVSGVVTISRWENGVHKVPLLAANAVRDFARIAMKKAKKAA